MPETRKRHSAEFKATVAVEAIKGIKTTAELASEFQVHPAQISQWKRHAVDGLPGLFQGPNTTAKLSLRPSPVLSTNRSVGSRSSSTG